jgi:hypothetical protein
VVSVTALRDAQDAIIGYLLIGTDNTARKHGGRGAAQGGGAAARDLQQRQILEHRHRREGLSSRSSTSAPSGCWATRPPTMVNKITPADISDPQEVISRAKALERRARPPRLRRASKAWSSRPAAGIETSTS